jgi:hypothetical protein
MCAKLFQRPVASAYISVTDVSNPNSVGSGPVNRPSAMAGPRRVLRVCTHTGFTRNVSAIETLLFVLKFAQHSHQTRTQHCALPVYGKVGYNDKLVV